MFSVFFTVNTGFNQILVPRVQSAPFGPGDLLDSLHHPRVIPHLSPFHLCSFSSPHRHLSISFSSITIIILFPCTLPLAFCHSVSSYHPSVTFANSHHTPRISRPSLSPPHFLLSFPSLLVCSPYFLSSFFLSPLHLCYIALFLSFSVSAILTTDRTPVYSHINSVSVLLTVCAISHFFFFLSLSPSLFHIFNFRYFAASNGPC